MSHIAAFKTISVDRRFDHGRAVVTVSGEIDLATAPQLRAVLDQALDAGAHEVWLDLRATTFMDSSGLHAIFSSRARAEALGRRLAIVCPPGPVRRLFDITGYSERLPLHDELVPER